MTTRPLIQRLRRLAAAGAVLALPAGLVAMGPAQAAAEEDTSDSLIVAVNQSVDTFNPFKSRFVITYNTRLLTYETLIRTGADDYEPSPGLATDWEESDDGLTWTFTIRDDSVWSDGEPVTAHDAAYTYRLLMENEAIRDWNIDFAGNLAGVAAPDDTTLVIRLNEPSTDILTADYSIVPQHIWENYDDPADDLANDQLPMVGSGPFQVVEHRPEEFIRLEANEDYWDGAPGFDELIFRYYTEPDAAVAALGAGDVDIVSALNPAQAASLEGNENITVNRAQNRRWVSIVLNHGARTADGTEYGDGHPALADVTVRQAMHHAINKQQLVDTVLDGLGDPGVGIVPKIFETFHWDGGDELVEFNLDEANAMLDDAGYERGPDGVRTMPGSDEPLAFRLFHHAENTDYATIVQFLQEWWEEIGLDIAIEPVEGPELNNQVYLGRFDIAFSGWGVGPNPTSILSQHTCAVLPTRQDGEERSHENFYCNEEYDTLHEEQRRTADIDARAELVKEQQRILYHDAPVIWLYYQNIVEAYNSAKVENLRTQPADNGMITGQQGFLWAYHAAQPAGSGGGGLSSGALIGAAGVLVIAAAVGGVVVMRRRSTADERE